MEHSTIFICNTTCVDELEQMGRNIVQYSFVIQPVDELEQMGGT